MTTPVRAIEQRWLNLEGDRHPSMHTLAVEAVAALESEFTYVPLDLLESLVEVDSCHFDHNGNCQGHGYFGLEQGELCPQQELKNIIADAPHAQTKKETTDA